MTSSKDLDNKNIVLLVMLDLSAVFDTIDLDILLQRLLTRLSVKGTALKWFQSYLCNTWAQSVRIGKMCSNPRPLHFCIPQSSVMGPILFTLYTSSLSDVISKHRVKYHLYADGTQLYLSFCPENETHQKERIQILERCMTVSVT